MGTRGKRARAGIAPKPKATPLLAAETQQVKPQIPDLSDVDMAFGNIKHMPRWQDLPEEFQRRSTPYNQFISGWFFKGIDDAELNRLKARPGVDFRKGLRAIGAIMRSFEPKHEHKEAGCAYLLSCWFELEPRT